MQNEKWIFYIIQSSNSTLYYPNKTKHLSFIALMLLNWINMRGLSDSRKPGVLLSPSPKSEEQGSWCSKSQPWSRRLMPQLCSQPERAHFPFLCLVVLFGCLIDWMMLLQSVEKLLFHSVQFIDSNTNLFQLYLRDTPRNDA